MASGEAYMLGVIYCTIAVIADLFHLICVIIRPLASVSEVQTDHFCSTRTNYSTYVRTYYCTVLLLASTVFY
jgi:hypothetical protein